MKLLKLIFVSLTLIAILVLISLPNSSDSTLVDSQKVEEFRKLPDFDFRREAEKLWDNGEQESALLLLQEIISNDWPDKAAAEQAYNDYGEEIRKRESKLGRLKALGSSFITGEVNSFEELAGASLADFFVYGDVRDLTKELVFEDNANELIVSLSALGLLTTIFPPADPMASLLKTSYKSGSLTAPMVKHINNVLEPLKKGTSKLSVANLKNIVAQLKPIWALAENSKSWQQFSLFMKHCKNTKQVKFLAKIISSPGNGKKLAALLSTLKTLPKHSAEALTYIHTYGQKGMDSLYSVLRKGPAGIQFLVKNPKLYSRLAKNTVKTSGLSKTMLNETWSKLLSKYGLPINILRYLIVLLLLFSIKLLFFKKSPTMSHETITVNAVDAKTQSASSNIYFWLASGLLISLLFIIPLNKTTEPVSTLTSVATNTGELKPSSIIFFIIFSLVQIWAVFKAKTEIDEIQRVKSDDKKIRLLENSEFYFDLPVYAGLAGTVCAFILLNYDPGGSRILAYATTVTGIIISVVVRGKWLFPIKKKIIQGEQNE